MNLSLRHIRRTLLLMGISLMANLAAQAQAPVRVGSKIDTEGKLLGHIVVLALEANGVAADRKLTI